MRVSVVDHCDRRHSHRLQLLLLEIARKNGLPKAILRRKERRRRKGMITLEAWTTFRYLFHYGKGKEALARELRIGRNTVRRAVAMNGRREYRRFVPERHASDQEGHDVS